MPTDSDSTSSFKAIHTQSNMYHRHKGNDTANSSRPLHGGEAVANAGKKKKFNPSAKASMLASIVYVSHDDASLSDELAEAKSKIISNYENDDADDEGSNFAGSEDGEHDVDFVSTKSNEFDDETGRIITPLMDIRRKIFAGVCIRIYLLL